MKNILTTLMTSAVLLSGIAVTSTSLHAAGAPDPVSKVLADARTHSSQLSVDWKSYNRQPNPSSPSEAVELARMKEDVSAAEKTIAELNDSRSQASPSIAAAIDRIIPVMEEIADSTSEAIEFLTANQARLSSKEYREYVDDSADTSNRLSGLIAQLVDYASHKTKFDEAKRSLELSAN